MGTENSKHAPPPSPAPLFDRPWRTIEWGTGKTANLLYLKTYKPQAEGRQLRILLHGPAGAGKSSFINSVSSALKGRICTLALVDNTSHDSFTTTYLTYKIQKDKPGTFYPFVFNDIRGLDPQKGVLVDDIELALMGHVKEGYMFNPGCKLSEGNEFYNKSPTDNDKVHVLVCVVPAHTLSSMNDKTVWEIRDVRMKASRLGIPQVAILTNVDQACSETKKDLKNVYRSRYIKEKMEQFSANVGIPMNCIFPVKNYHEEIKLNDDTDALILSVLRHIINYGDDFINWKAE